MTRTNPYPDEATLLFWHDMFRDKLETSNADWRECSYLVNSLLPQYRKGRLALDSPWICLFRAWNDERERADRLQREVEELRQQNHGLKALVHCLTRRILRRKAHVCEQSSRSTASISMTHP